MNRYILIILFILMNTFCFGQKFLTSGGIGYNFVDLSPYRELFYSNNTIENVKFKLAKGYLLNLSFSYSITENIYFDLGMNYFSSEDDPYNYAGSEDKINREMNYSASGISFEPSIKIQTNFKNIYPFLKYGLTVNFLEVTQNIKANSPYSNLNFEYVYEMDPCFGTSFSIGTLIKLNDHIYLIPELKYSFLDFSPSTVIYKSGDYTKKYSLKDKISTYSYGELLSKHFPINPISIQISIAYGY